MLSSLMGTEGHERDPYRCFSFYASSLEQICKQQNEEEIVEVPAHNRRRKKHGRNSIPAELITESTIDLSEEEKKCSCCGGELHQFDTKEHTVVERIPAKYTATRYRIPVYSCSRRKNGVTSMEMPFVTPINKG